MGGGRGGRCGQSSDAHSAGVRGPPVRKIPEEKREGWGERSPFSGPRRARHGASVWREGPRTDLGSEIWGTSIDLKRPGRGGRRAAGGRARGRAAAAASALSLPFFRAALAPPPLLEGGGARPCAREAAPAARTGGAARVRAGAGGMHFHIHPSRARGGGARPGRGPRPAAPATPRGRREGEGARRLPTASGRNKRRAN